MGVSNMMKVLAISLPRKQAANQVEQGKHRYSPPMALTACGYETSCRSVFPNLQHHQHPHGPRAGEITTQVQAAPYDTPSDHELRGTPDEPDAQTTNSRPIRIYPGLARPGRGQRAWPSG